MNTFIRALLVGLFAVTLTVACSKKTDEAAEAAKAEMGQAVDATKDAAAAATTDVKDAAAKTEAAAAGAKAEAVDAIQAAKDAAAAANK